MWQIKQGVWILGKLYIDRVNQFGGCASPAIFIAVNALVAWVAKHERLVEDLIYVDDLFGVEDEEWKGQSRPELVAGSREHIVLQLGFHYVCMFYLKS